MVLARMSCVSSASKKNHVFKNVMKSLKKVRFEMCFDNSNELFGTEFIWNNILVKGISILIQNYKITTLSVVLLNFTKNVLRAFPLTLHMSFGIHTSQCMLFS
jgi:hypothetical protein